MNVEFAPLSIGANFIPRRFIKVQKKSMPAGYALFRCKKCDRKYCKFCSTSSLDGAKVRGWGCSLNAVWPAGTGAAAMAPTVLGCFGKRGARGACES